MLSMGKCVAVIVAAGKGVRMGNGVRKQYRILGDRPVLARTLSLFHKRPEINRIVLVVNIRVKKIICGYSRKMVPCEVVARNLYFQMAGLLQRGGTDIAQGSDQEFMDLQTLFFETGHLAQRIRRESAKDMFLRISNRGKVPCGRDQFPVIIPFAVVFGPMEVKEVLQEL